MPYSREDEIDYDSDGGPGHSQTTNTQTNQSIQPSQTNHSTRPPQTMQTPATARIRPNEIETEVGSPEPKRPRNSLFVGSKETHGSKGSKVPTNAITPLTSKQNGNTNTNVNSPNILGTPINNTRTVVNDCVNSDCVDNGVDNDSVDNDSVDNSRKTYNASTPTPTLPDTPETPASKYQTAPQGVQQICLVNENFIVKNGNITKPIRTYFKEHGCDVFENIDDYTFLPNQNKTLNDFKLILPNLTTEFGINYDVIGKVKISIWEKQSSFFQKDSDFRIYELGAIYQEKYDRREAQYTAHITGLEGTNLELQKDKDNFTKEKTDWEKQKLEFAKEIEELKNGTKLLTHENNALQFTNESLVERCNKRIEGEKVDALQKELDDEKQTTAELRGNIEHLKDEAKRIQKFSDSKIKELTEQSQKEIANAQKEIANAKKATTNLAEKATTDLHNTIQESQKAMKKMTEENQKDTEQLKNELKKAKAHLDEGERAKIKAAEESSKLYKNVEQLLADNDFLHKKIKILEAEIEELKSKQEIAEKKISEMRKIQDSIKNIQL